LFTEDTRRYIRRARLVLGWAAVSACYQPPRSTQPGQPIVGRRSKSVTAYGAWEDIRQPYSTGTSVTVANSK